MDADLSADFRRQHRNSVNQRRNQHPILQWQSPFVGEEDNLISAACDIMGRILHNVSEESQLRLRRLLTLNSEGLLGEGERRELDELAQPEHVLVMLKAHSIQK